jgi:NADH:ubiquinone oxidoreductase subunit 5 (subunit L)/multisubunit Na+/H+ antiporter MnhA subunit
MAISALPGFNGFVSELLIYLGICCGFQLGDLAVNVGSIIATGGLAFIGALALFAFLRLYSFIFLGTARSPQAAAAVEVPALMLIVPAVLAILCLGLGLFAVLGIYLVNPVAVYLGYPSVLSGSLWQVLKVLSIVIPVFFAIFVALYLSRSRFLRKTCEPTWGCGYEHPTARMQYSGNSFIGPIAYFLKPFMRRRTRLHTVTDIFPQQLESHTELRDFVDNGGIRPLVDKIASVFRFFARIDSDKTQVYITYLLIFLIALLCIVVLGVR